MAPSPPAQYYVNVAFPEEHGPQSIHLTQVKQDSSCRKGKEAKKRKKGDRNKRLTVERDPKCFKIVQRQEA